MKTPTRRDPRPTEELRPHDMDEEHTTLPEHLAAVLRVLPERHELRPQDADQHQDEHHRAGGDDRGRDPVVAHPAELDVERAADREEEVDVDEG